MSRWKFLLLARKNYGFYSFKNDLGYQGVALESYNPFTDKATIRVSQNGTIVGWHDVTRREYLNLRKQDLGA